ncbi:MAG: SpoIIE family protein phosphatase [Kouleothrix sp.]|nr:SpoIIE family protein phosphatase [Kouleothrix sp.]
MGRPSLRWLLVPPETDDSAEGGARTSIASRLRWSFLISSTLPLLLVGALLLFINASAQQSSVYNDQKDLANRVERDISRYVDDLHSELERFALKVRPVTSAQLASLAREVVDRNYPSVVDLSVMDGQGVERLRMVKLLTIREDELLNRGADPLVQRALHEGATTYTPIVRRPDGLRSFTITMPIRNDANNVVGALRAELSAETIAQELLISISNSKSYPYLVQTSNGQLLLDDGRPDFKPPRELHRLLIAPAGTEQYSGARGQDVIGALVPVIVKADQTGWSVVVEQPSATAFASVRNSILILALLVILVGALALMWAFRQAQHFLRPLAALRTGATALGAGQLDYRIESLGNDEMGELAHTFNQMAEHLQQSLVEIERRNDRLRRAMLLARDIQIGLLPDRPPWNGDEIAVYARSIPAYEVGGDFYSYLAMSEGRAAIAIGDISGKGVGAALLMALTSSAVETQGRQVEHPAQVLTALNNLLAPRLRANHMNAALLFVVIDPRSRTLRVANAGMIAPVLVSASGSHFIEVGGLPLGSFAGAIYQELTVPYEPGDSLLLLSDGVVEAHDPHGELFGFEQLEQTIAQAQPGNVRDMVELVLDRVQKHMGEAEQHDDITIVAVRPAVASENAVIEEDQSITYATI